ncbi:MAG: hypothetical protein JW804_04210 [Sedimentisphaerales bacterium]|nr:hypothetical protein [Sedimentisphaerales bacterium]
MITQRKKIRKEKAFTIVELLTVMSVIIILIGLLVPALNEVRRYAQDVKQNAQLHSINIALELYEKEFEEYPPSSRYDGDGNPGSEYCGALKLAEAMVGQDLLGFHPDSLFRADFESDNGLEQYYVMAKNDPADTPENRRSRKPAYLPLEQAGAVKLEELYGAGNAVPPYEDHFLVLTDVYTRRMMGPEGTRYGMPILYYKANPAGEINPNEDNNYTLNESRIYFYDYEDNDELVKLGVPWDTTASNMKHYMASDNTSADAFPGMGTLEDFYWRINNDDIKIQDGRPYRSDSYILLSAGSDGLYGTRDDIYNFHKK